MTGLCRTTASTLHQQSVRRGAEILATPQKKAQRSEKILRMQDCMSAGEPTLRTQWLQRPLDHGVLHPAQKAAVMSAP